MKLQKSLQLLIIRQHLSFQSVVNNPDLPTQSQSGSLIMLENTLTMFDTFTKIYQGEGSVRAGIYSTYMRKYMY